MRLNFVSTIVTPNLVKELVTKYKQQSSVVLKINISLFSHQHTEHAATLRQGARFGCGFLLS